MTQQDLDQPDVGAALVEVRGEAVPQDVRRDRLAEPGVTSRLAAGLLQRADADRIFNVAAWEQPEPRPGLVPVRTQNLQQLLVVFGRGTWSRN